MKVSDLRKIQKLYFGYEELARVLGISMASARVAASRYVKMNVLLRIRRNLYVLREIWERATQEEKFVLANLGEAPSYISLMTALAYYDATTQLQRDFFESVSVLRTKTISIGGSIFRYSKISEDLYFGFEKINDFFIARPEKALVDAIYLMSYGRYALDLTSVDTEKLDASVIEKIARRFPKRTLTKLESYGYVKAT
jgi:predicted transcriptional regulator of viral defense system